MTELSLTELRKVAEATFPCEDWAIWTDVKDGGYVHVGNAQGVIPDGEFTTPDDAEPNLVAKAMTPDLGAHIATFDPPTVLALLDRVAELEAKVARVESLRQAAEVVVLDAGDEATGPEPDPNLAELAHCVAALAGEPGRSEAEIKAEALREAAEAWTQGAWATDMPPKGADRPALILGMAQSAGDWLRARAARLAFPTDTEGRTDHE